MMKKVNVLVMGTGNATSQFIVKNENNEYIKIIGIIQDSSVSEKDRSVFFKKLNSLLNNRIEEFNFSDECLRRADIIFLPEYRRIIPRELTEKYIFINCHGGILPKWRGFSANAWAIMNGEHEIGFSIHRVRPELDDGEIFFIKRIPILEEQTYADVHGNMVDGIAEDVPKVLYEVFNGINTGVKQTKDGFAYCNKFSRSMGDLCSFGEKSSYYVNLWRCMAKPLGTGVWFEYKGKNFEVGKVEHGKEYGVINYIGISGKIVNIFGDKLWVKTKDNVVILSDIKSNGTNINLLDYFMNGNILGR